MSKCHIVKRAYSEPQIVCSVPRECASVVKVNDFTDVFLPGGKTEQEASAT